MRNAGTAYAERRYQLGAVLTDYDNDVDKLKAAEPWLFSASPAPAPAGATGLPNAGAATDEGAQMRRWRRIAGLSEDKE